MAKKKQSIKEYAKNNLANISPNTFFDSNVTPLLGLYLNGGGSGDPKAVVTSSDEVTGCEEALVAGRWSQCS